MQIEKIIFENLLYNDEYNRKVIAFLKPDYFSEPSDKTLFDIIHKYFTKYNNFPTKEAIEIELDGIKNLPQTIYDDTLSSLKKLSKVDLKETEWMVDKTEEFCQNKALYNAMMKAIEIVGEDVNKDQLAKGALPQILSDALAVSFDLAIGHEWFDDAMKRFDYYHQNQKRIPFHLDMLNRITGGGIFAGTLSIIMAGTGVGKTITMCDMAAHNLEKGYNVLYITMEMAEEEIARRIDANLLDIAINDLPMVQKKTFEQKVATVNEKTSSKLYIKQYPTSGAGVNNFRHLLSELKIKKNFKPDIIYIDYLNICMSSRIRISSNVNSYTYIKSIAEELRGLAIEQQVPIVSATQVNRSGFSDSDFDLEHTSESWGLPQTVDFMIALIQTADLVELNQIMIKQLKNRYNDLNYFRKFVVGIDKTKMRLYNVEQSAQDDIIDDRPAFDKSKFGSEDDERGKKKGKRKSFDDFI